MDAIFDRVFANVVGEEGGFTNDPRDRGNWTGGECGVGACKGTKYGISAASYPNVDIENLTLDAAKEIYRTDFWLKLRCDRMTPPLAEFVFDYAVNSGTGRAAKELQKAVGVLQDCVIGPATLAAINAKPPGQILRLMFVSRAKTMAESPKYEIYKDGWFARLFDVTARYYLNGGR